MHDATPDGPSWLDTSQADFDKRLAVKGHKRDSADQAGLFFTPTPTAARPAPARVELPGQDVLFGGES
jgi:hypothetical protein